MSYIKPSSTSVQKKTQTPAQNRTVNDFDNINPLETRAIYEANIFDTELREIVFGKGGKSGEDNAIYKSSAREGDGSIMTAAINEQRTGVPTGGKMHTQRCREALDRITKWIDMHDSAANSSDIKHAEMRCAIQIRDDLLRALGPNAIFREAHIADKYGKPRK